MNKFIIDVESHIIKHAVRSNEDEVREGLQTMITRRGELLARKDVIGLNEGERNDLREITRFLNKFHVQTSFRYAV